MLADLKQVPKKIDKTRITEIQSMDVSAHAAPLINMAPHHLQHPRIKSERDADTDNRAFEKMAWIAQVTIYCLHVYIPGPVGCSCLTQNCWRR